MSEASPAGRPAGRIPTGAPAAALTAAVVCGLACLGLGLTAPADARRWVLGVAVVYGMLLCVAVGWTAGAVRRNRALRRVAREADDRSSELRQQLAAAHT